MHGGDFGNPGHPLQRLGKLSSGKTATPPIITVGELIIPPAQDPCQVPAPREHEETPDPSQQQGDTAMPVFDAHTAPRVNGQ